MDPAAMLCGCYLPAGMPVLVWLDQQGGDTLDRACDWHRILLRRNCSVVQRITELLGFGISDTSSNSTRRKRS